MDFWGQLGTVFLFGLVGSFHCAAMCGPLAAAGEATGPGGMVAYHFTRIAAYGAVGLIVGFLSAQILVEGMQNVGVNTGVIFVFVSLFYALSELYGALTKRRVSGAGKFLSKWRHTLQKKLLTLGVSRSVIFGLLTAILPCGFLYAGVAQAAALGHPLKSALAMMIFGIATAPALWSGMRLVTFIRKLFPNHHRLGLALLLCLVSLGTLWRSWPSEGGQHEHMHHH